MEPEKIETEKMTLPKPQKEEETVTTSPQAKKQRSAKQMQWSRELGKRSQEFKKAKNAMLTKTIETPTTETNITETSTPVKTTTPYLLYFTLVGGGLVGVYYYFTYKWHPKIEAVEKPKVSPKKPTNLTKME